MLIASLVVILMSAPTLTAASADPGSSDLQNTANGGALASVAAKRLCAALQDERSPYSDVVLGQLARDTGLPPEVLRARLDSLLTRIEQRYDSRSWRNLVERASNKVSPAIVDRFLRRSVREGHVLLHARGRYPLDSRIRVAARRSRLSAYRGRDILLHSLREVHTGTTSADTSGGSGVIVSGRTNRFRVPLETLLLFFGSQDEAMVKEQVREIHRFLVPALVRRLPLAANVRWALSKRDYTPLVVPRYELRVLVNGLTFTGDNRDLRPCLDATAELLQWSHDTPLHTWNIQFCTRTHGSGTSHDLTPFFDEAADDIRDRIDAFMSAP